MHNYLIRLQNIRRCYIIYIYEDEAKENKDRRGDMPEVPQELGIEESPTQTMPILPFPAV